MAPEGCNCTEPVVLCSGSDASVQVAFRHFPKIFGSPGVLDPTGITHLCETLRKLNRVRKLRWRVNSLAPRNNIGLGSVLTFSDGCRMSFSLGRRRYFSKRFRPPSYARKFIKSSTPIYIYIYIIPYIFPITWDKKGSL